MAISWQNGFTEESHLTMEHNGGDSRDQGLVDKNSDAEQLHESTLCCSKEASSKLNVVIV